MKTWGVGVGLIAFMLVLASSLTMGSAAPKSSGPSIRAWALADFEGNNTVQSALKLWNDANYLKGAKERWRGSGLNAAVLSISVVRPVGRTDARPVSKQGVPGAFDAIILIRAGDEATLIKVEAYIEKYYSHVDMYRIDEGG